MNRPLRIAYFAEFFPSQSETWVHHEIEALLSLGCHVQVFATKPRPECIAPELQHFCGLTTYLRDIKPIFARKVKRIVSIRLISFFIRGILGDARGFRRKLQMSRDLLFIARFYDEISRFAPDLTYAHFAGTRTNLAFYFYLLTSTPYIIKMHAGDVFERVALLKMKTNLALLVITISEYNVRFIREHYPDVDSAKIIIHRCGIPMEAFTFEPFKPGDGPPVIVSVGRLVKMKGFDLLIEASRRLLDNGIDHRVFILGDGPEKSRLEEQVHELVLDDQVQLLGYCAPELVKTMLKSAAAFVLPARWDKATKAQDGIPVALMEAMAKGVPVVSTYTSGIPELVVDGVTGYLAKPDDPQSLASALRRCLETKGDEQEQMLVAARTKIEQDYDIKILTAELLTLMNARLAVREYHSGSISASEGHT